MYVRFLRSDAVMERLPKGSIDETLYGPFEFVQLTYNDIRTDEGDLLAQYDPKDDVWYLYSLSEHIGQGWSDIVIYNEERV